MTEGSEPPDDLKIIVDAEGKLNERSRKRTASAIERLRVASVRGLKSQAPGDIHEGDDTPTVPTKKIKSLKPKK